MTIFLRKKLNYNSKLLFGFIIFTYSCSSPQTYLQKEEKIVPSAIVSKVTAPNVIKSTQTVTVPEQKNPAEVINVPKPSAIPSVSDNFSPVPVSASPIFSAPAIPTNNPISTPLTSVNNQTNNSSENSVSIIIVSPKPTSSSTSGAIIGGIGG